jgi:hypothetical protein
MVHQHALANLVSRYSKPSSWDSYRLMDQWSTSALPDIPFEDVEVVPQIVVSVTRMTGFARSGLRDGDMFDPDLIGTTKNERPHS